MIKEFDKARPVISCNAQASDDPDERHGIGVYASSALSVQGLDVEKCRVGVRVDADATKCEGFVTLLADLNVKNCSRGIDVHDTCSIQMTAVNVTSCSGSSSVVGVKLVSEKQVDITALTLRYVQ